MPFRLDHFIGLIREYLVVADSSSWKELPGFSIEIAGLDGAMLRMTATGAMTIRDVAVAVIHFEFSLTVPTTYATFSHRGHFSDYGGLKSFQAALVAVRNGSGSSASLVGGGFRVAIELVRSGVREGIQVSGYCSSSMADRHQPWPDGEALSRMTLVDESAAANINFAFQSALVDPPYIDNAIAQTNHLIQELEAGGFVL